MKEMTRRLTHDTFSSYSFFISSSFQNSCYDRCTHHIQAKTFFRSSAFLHLTLDIFLLYTGGKRRTIRFNNKIADIKRYKT